MRIDVRRDPVVPTRISIISGIRKFRPKEYIESERREEIRRIECPFCPGHEHMTPPAVLVAKLENGKLVFYRDSDSQRITGWIVRVFPNKYPALIPEDPKSPAYGYHEVIVETPNHDREAYLTSIEHYSLSLRILMKRLSDIMTDPRICHVIAIKNYGPRSGASLEHPHMQIFATTFPLPYIVEEVVYTVHKYESEGVCPYCRLIEEDSKTEHKVYENECFIALASRAPRSPYEVWILPKEHVDMPFGMSDYEYKLLADVLAKVLKTYHSFLGNPSYNMWIHIPPKRIDGLSRIVYHWHIEISPVLTTWGGFEKGSGVYIVPVSPEEAGRNLRECIEKGLC